MGAMGALTGCFGLVKIIPDQNALHAESSKCGRFLFLGHDRSVHLTVLFVCRSDRSVRLSLGPLRSL